MVKKFSDKMKETLLRIRLGDLNYKFLILTRGNTSEVAKLLTSYEKSVRRHLKDDREFGEWCKVALGLSPKELLEGEREKTEKEIVDLINKKIDKSIKILEKKGIKVTKI